VDLLKQHGFPVPKTVVLDSIADLRRVDFFPAILKPYVNGGGSSHTYLIQDAEELKLFCRYLLKYGLKLMVQEYIGTGEGEYTVGVLSDPQGAVMTTVGIRRFVSFGLSNRMRVRSRSKKGETLIVSSGISQGVIIGDRTILNQCRNIARALLSTGPLNIQCRVVKGKVYTFEINPRFSGTSYMRALAGINEPDLWIRRCLLGEALARNLAPRRGMIIRGLVEKFIPEGTPVKSLV
jgi:carbamoyl-phosphate synthase large subunit